MKRLSILSILTALTLGTPAQAQAFAREFKQNQQPGVFHPEKSNAKLCLFVYSRQGALLIQPHCMVSTSSHTRTTVSRVSKPQP